MRSCTGPAERFAEILAGSLNDLLASLGLVGIPVPVPASRPSGEDAICAVARFGSGRLCGSLALLGDIDLFRKLRPNPPIAGQINPGDWACELANQAVGRMRNRLLDHDVDLGAGIPELKPAHEVARLLCLMPVCLPRVLSVDDQLLEAWLQATFPPNFSFPKPNPVQSSRALAEGAVMLF